MATQVYNMAEQPDPNNYNGGFGGYSDQPNSGGNPGYGDQINGEGQPPLSPYSSHQNLNVSGVIKSRDFLSYKNYFFFQSGRDNNVSRVNTTLND